MKNEQITDSLVLVKLSIRGWWGKVTSAEIEAEVEKKHKAKSGSVSARVVQLCDAYRKRLTQIKDRAWKWQNERTRPWEDGGWRVVPVEKYIELVDGAAQFARELEDVIDEIVENFDAVKEETRREVNGLFNENRFPTRSFFSNRYSITLQTGAITNIDDVRLAAMEDTQREEIKSEIEARYTAQIEAGTRDLAERLRDVAKDIVDRTARDPKNIQFKTLIDKIKKTLDILPALNVTDDRKIDKAIKKTESLLKECDAEGLRTDAKVRKKANKKAKNILDDLSIF